MYQNISEPFILMSSTEKLWIYFQNGHDTPNGSVWKCFDVIQASKPSTLASNNNYNQITTITTKYTVKISFYAKSTNTT
jgi:hypothetical protein